ncbi:MAG: dihydrolipoamide dehydrogenase [Candidatus Azotimanducaceae bacterium]|jgi:dihydrolipoamide dehydrogenase
MNEYDVVVIGAGPGGYTAAIRASQLGLKTTLIEKAELGGTCLNWGCIPTKSLLHSADIVRTLRTADDLGIKTGKVSIDLAKMVGASRQAASRLNQGVGQLMKKYKIDIQVGEAKLLEPGLVAVNGSECFADNIIVATGARARTLDKLVPDGKVVWNAVSAMTPKKLPDDLLIIGAGAIGVEFASFYNTLGCNVTLVEMLEEILPSEDAEIAATARACFESLGIKVITGAQVSHITVGKKLKCLINDIPFEFDNVISSVGVTGNVEDLGLETLGVETERGFISVNQSQQTNVAGVYAIGDVAGAPCLAHKASHEGVIAIEAIAGLNPHPLKLQQIPACTYSYPQIASIGLNEAACTGRDIRVGRFPLFANGKAVAVGETEGMIKTIFDLGTGELLGAHMVGSGVSEMIQGYAIAMQMESTEVELMNTIFPHPTISESMHEAVLDAWSRTLSL